MNAPALDFRFGIDRLVANEGRVFGWGWAAGGNSPIADMALLVRLGETMTRLVATHGLDRPDVAEAFPGLAGARTSGFTVTGFVARAADSVFELEIRFRDGTSTAVSALPTMQEEDRRPRPTWPGRLRAVMRRLLAGDFKGLHERVRDQTSSPPLIDPAGLRRALGRAKGSRYVVIFDHDMGGGANTYRREQIAQLHADGATTILVTCHMSTLDYRVRIQAADADGDVFRAAHLLDVEPLFDAVAGIDVIVNSPVSFDDPLLLAEWLGRMRRDGRIRELIVTAHDHFAICPSFVLLDADGHFCNVPDVEICARCLPRHRAPHMNLSPRTPIPQWRVSWLRCLQAADEIRCFSQATQLLLQKAFPTLDPARLTVRPHQLVPGGLRTPARPVDRDAVIGIVGHINDYKGAQIVAEMVTTAEAAAAPVRFVVFGTLEAAIRSPRLVVTGSYQRETLPALIERHGANVFAFTSICPETFSYVVEELMTMRVPVVSFALGAQGEKVARYSQGRLCHVMNGKAMLDAALALHVDCVGTSTPATATELQ